MLDLSECLFDGVQVWAVWGQVEELGANGTDGLPDGWPLVAAEVIHHDDISSAESGHEDAFDVDLECIPIHRAVDDPRRIDAIVAQGGDKSAGVPMSERGRPRQTFSFGRPSPQGRHVRLRPRLVDENEPGRVDLALVPLPSHPTPGDIGSFAFIGYRCLFLKLNPSRCTKAQTAR